jgi:cell division septal protein FtsQ
LSDEEIINIAKLSDYPTIIDANTLSIKNNLEKNIYIRKAKVYKKGFFNQVYIDIEENYPLFMYQDKIYLYNLKTTKDNKIVPIVTNEIPEDVFNEFVKSMRIVNIDILERISEIKYDSNGIDKGRFKLTMNDGIYVYVTLLKFEKINNYDKIVSTLDDKKGILYLDSGEYLELFKN